MGPVFLFFCTIFLVSFYSSLIFACYFCRLSHELRRSYTRQISDHSPRLWDRGLLGPSLSNETHRYSQAGRQAGRVLLRKIIIIAPTSKSQGISYSPLKIYIFQRKKYGFKEITNAKIIPFPRIVTSWLQNGEFSGTGARQNLNKHNRLNARHNNRGNLVELQKPLGKN